MKFPIALRGAFDGGKSEEGVGCGAWLEAAFVSQYHFLVRVFSHMSWEPVLQRAWTLPCESTVTQAELSAVECLIHNMVGIVGSLIECSSRVMHD